MATMTPSKPKVTPITISLEFYEEHMEDDMGICLNCGAEIYGVEPDAREYECEACGEPRVFGLEELLMMGRVR